MRTHLLGQPIALALLLFTPTAVVAQEDYVILRSFGHLPPFAGGVSPLQKGRDGRLYTRHQTTWHEMALDGTLTPLGETPPIALSMDGGDGFFYYDDGGTFWKLQDGEPPTVFYQVDTSAEGSAIGSAVLGADGHFYGLTGYGAKSSIGTLYRLTRTGVFTTLHIFTVAEGTPAFTQLLRGSDDLLYSTSYDGGVGHGVIHRITYDGTVSPLYTFTGVEGRTPRYGLRQASDGWMYGVTLGSGSLQPTVFKVRSDGMFQVLHTFNDADGPAMAVTSAPMEFSDGNFYGSTLAGIYQMTPAGAIRVLHNAAFSVPSYAGYDRWGAGPNVVEGSDRNLYGTAVNGGPDGNGVLFRLNRQRVRCTNTVTPEWQGDDTYSVLYLLGAVKSVTPALFSTWLVTKYGVQPLWLGVTPPIDPTFAYESQMPFPRIGMVGIFTVVVTATLDVCADWKTEDTGVAGPTAEELTQLLNAHLLRRER
jgi:uncharacterized repeat protein (TIGR03803 family)